MLVLSSMFAYAHVCLTHSNHEYQHFGIAHAHIRSKSYHNSVANHLSNQQFEHSQAEHREHVLRARVNCNYAREENHHTHSIHLWTQRSSENCHYVHIQQFFRPKKITKEKIRSNNFIKTISFQKNQHLNVFNT